MNPPSPVTGSIRTAATEDAATLAACLAQRGEAGAASALRRYEALRLPRATRLQEMSRANKTRFHLPDGPAQQERDALLATRGDRSIAALDWLYSHDASVIDANHAHP